MQFCSWRMDIQINQIFSWILLSAKTFAFTGSAIFPIWRVPFLTCGRQLNTPTMDIHTNRLSFFDLSLSQQDRFEHLGELPDIDNSILNAEKAVDLTKFDSLDKPSYLSNLDDIENSNQQMALALCDDTNPEKRTHLSNLSSG
jgi:hypothetical protein